MTMKETLIDLLNNKTPSYIISYMGAGFTDDYETDFIKQDIYNLEDIYTYLVDEFYDIEMHQIDHDGVINVEWVNRTLEKAINLLDKEEKNIPIDMDDFILLYEWFNGKIIICKCKDGNTYTGICDINIDNDDCIYIDERKISINDVVHIEKSDKNVDNYDFAKLYPDLWEKNVRCFCKNGRVFEGMFMDEFDDENSIVIGSTIININDIERMEKIKN